MKEVYRDNMPCWYELSWQKTKPAIKLLVHKDFIKNTKIVRQDAPIVTDLEKEFGFAHFVGDFNGNFGFDDAFIHDGETKEFVKFIIEIPKIKKKTGNCSYCNGSGQNKELGTKCFYCNGNGNEYIFDYKSAYTISASFTVFSTLSRFPEKETSSSLLQLMRVSTTTGREMHGCFLGGEFSVPLCNWMDSLREKGESRILEMTKAMQLAHEIMIGLEAYEYRFRASVDYEGGWLNVSCPGNACGLNPEHMGPQKGKGYKFIDHNVDSPAQQIELIAGLAALHDKARKEMKMIF